MDNFYLAKSSNDLCIINLDLLESVTYAGGQITFCFGTNTVHLYYGTESEAKKIIKSVYEHIQTLKGVKVESDTL